MAIWQYQLSLFPKNVCDSIYGKKNLNLTEDLLDTLNLWKSFNEIEQLLESLEKILPRGKAWWENMFLFGEASTNDIQIYFDWEKINSILLRIDLREFDKKVFQWLTLWIERYQLSAFDGNEIILEPSKEAIFWSIAKSQAFKFLKNPDKFFLEKE